MKRLLFLISAIVIGLAATTAAVPPVTAGPSGPTNWPALLNCSDVNADGSVTVGDIGLVVQRFGTAAVQDSDKVISHGRLTLHLDSQSAVWDDIPVSLTRLEFNLVLLLSGRPDQVVPEEEIFALIGAEAPNIVHKKDDIRNVILDLRRKFRGVDSSFTGIEFIPGRGFAWRG